ncbi:serine/threonine-protein kinase [Pyxidicoccus xibeiensis]|uniref:serine/threonine-protein kinase n=1 Tax=Pyxidicoccus xibeiensis TaxID=2906759 RepID=UPI0020A784BD|nr:serine/threonine-protein kinase [Pyxidicoccus xibeiensis]MCP3136091.1 serine/threonine protein kinase [Pyxidicoccus xibeiensis]
MASELTCDTCGLSVPPDTAVCPRDGTVVLTSFHVPPGAATEEPKVVVQASEAPPADASLKDPLVGLRLGEYELRSRIGVGGMGLVYEGIQPLIGKRVAVKVLRPELAHSTEQVERLLAEARAVNAIRHRGIIDIFGFGQVPDGRQYIVMEYLEGQALDAVLTEKNRLPVQDALSLLDEVLAALAAAHGAGVVHRDLKPSNIFLVKQPDGSRYVKVLDFGLAKRGQGPTGRTAQTRTDMVVGTPEYMAPEQARGQEVGPMTDLYALGVVTFEMVTGRLPFVGSSPVDLLMKHVEARPPRPSEFVSELPPALDAFILQMLTKDPETRPNSADALRQQLHKLRRTLRASTRSNPSAPAPVERPRRSDDVDSRRPTTPVPVPPELSSELTSQELRAAGVTPPGRKRVPMAAAIGAAVLLLGGGTAIVVRSMMAPQAPTSIPLAGTGTATPPAPAPETAPSGTPAPAPATAAAPAIADTAPAAGGVAAAAPMEAQARKVAAEDAPDATPSRVQAASTGAEAQRPKVSRGSEASSQSTLLSRIKRLEREVNTQAARGTLSSPNAALKMLEKYRGEALAAEDDPQTRRELVVKLNGFERVFLKR